MGQVAKYFRWIFFICTFFLSAYAVAQVGGGGYANAYKGFVADKMQANESPFLLVIVNKKNQDFLFKDPSIKIKRQLDDSAFIISINRKLTDAFLTKATWIAQANNNWKLSPNLLSSLLSKQLVLPNKFLIKVAQTSALTKWLDDKKIIFSKTSNANTFIVTISSKENFNELISQADVDFAGIYHTKPNYELQINDLDLSANKINKAHSKYPSLNGEGLTLSIKENLPDTNDIDIKGRYISNTIAPVNINPHSTIMATMAAGAGNSWYTGRGVANAASFTSSDFSNLLPDANSNYQQYNISVQNHSYGVGIENFYGADAAAYDAAASTNDKLLFVFSAGNSGTASPTTGSYTGINAVANLTGSFKQAKNIMTVGAIDSFGIVAAASSKGPAFDGRIKPEMVAYGLDGTSGAAALVSGTALLLQQAYKNNNGGNLPSSSLVKAVLLNSADEINHAPISFQSGYGNLNAEKAISDIAAQHYFTGSIANTATQAFSISIPANISKAKFTLVWNDTPAAPNAFKVLVNDLDLQIHDNAGTVIWKPWVLNSSANIDSLTLSPVRKRDSLNNIEQVTIDNPLPGNYTILIKGFQINTSTQAFAVAYHLDTASSFTWDFPTTTDNIFPASSNLIRWDENIVAANAQLSYSIDAGASWQAINNNIDLNKKYFRWDAPFTNALGILKMQIGTQSFVSDTFTISRKTDFKVGFNCADSVLWYWNKLNGVNNYQLYGLGNKYLEPINITTDTQFVFNKNTLAYKWFAVAPIINSRIGIKSYATDYSTQGTDCYIKDFTADLVNDNSASLQLTLGSLYLIKKIVFEKISGNEFTAIKTISSFSGLGYDFTDNALLMGNNVYRISIELQDGRIIRSFTTAVFFFAASDVVAYPNPVQQNTNLHFQFKNLQNQQVRIYDIAGRLVHQHTATSTQMDILATFAKGLYWISIYNPETNQKVLKKILIR